MKKFQENILDLIQIIFVSVWPMAPKKLEPVRVVSPTEMNYQQSAVRDQD